MQFAMRKTLFAVTFFCALRMAAQEPGEQAVGRGQFAGMQRVGGTVTAVAGDALTVKGEDGVTYQVTTTPNTRLMKGQGVAFKVADLKAGDGVMAVGNMDAPTKTLHAAMMFATDAEQLKKMRENLGKTYIAGRVTSIDTDNLKMTVPRADGVAQTIGFDETTSFKRGARAARGAGGGQGFGGAGGMVPVEGGESITLADIKVGDNVAGQGSIKSGVFVPAQLNVATPRPRREGERPRPTGIQTGPGAVTPPATTPPQK